MCLCLQICKLSWVWFCRWVFNWIFCLCLWAQSHAFTCEWGEQWEGHDPAPPLSHVLSLQLLPFPQHNTLNYIHGSQVSACKDKDKVLQWRKICYIFEKQGVQGYQIHPMSLISPVSPILVLQVHSNQGIRINSFSEAPYILCSYVSLMIQVPRPSQETNLPI